MPLVIASNRDEKYSRESEPPKLREGDFHDYVAPRDLERGGTWMGLNQTGLFVALTNPIETDAEYEQSRGELVDRILGTARTFPEVREMLVSFDLSRYGPFSLVVALPEGILSVSHGPGRPIEWNEHEQGDVVLSSEQGLEFFDPADWERFPWRRKSRREDPEKLRARLQGFCKRTEPFRHREAVCRKGEQAGTVSSAILLIERSESRVDFDYAPGPPCETPYRRVSFPTEFSDSVTARW